MNLAKISVNGQITVPVENRRWRRADGAAHRLPPVKCTKHLLHAIADHDPAFGNHCL